MANGPLVEKVLTSDPEVEELLFNKLIIVD